MMMRWILILLLLVPCVAKAEDMLADKHMKALNDALYEGIPKGPYSVYVEDLPPIDMKMYPAVLFFEPASGLLGDMAESTAHTFVKRIYVFNDQPMITVVAYVPNDKAKDAAYLNLIDQRLRNVTDYLEQKEGVPAGRIKKDIRPSGIVPCTLAPKECIALLHRIELHVSAE